MWNNPRALDQVSNAAFALAALLLLGGLAVRAAHQSEFELREISLHGDVAHVTREQVETIVFDALEGTFFTVDLRHARAAFESLPWVRRVEVRRRWPNGLEVFVEEHRELARWGSTALVNRYGEVFEGASNEKLPVFEGPEGTHVEITRHYGLFNEALEDIGRQVDHVELSARRAWRLRLDDGTVIELGREHVLPRLSGFVAAYERSVAELQGKAMYVDLRYANGFAVRVKNQKWSETRA